MLSSFEKKELIRFLTPFTDGVQILVRDGLVTKELKKAEFKFIDGEGCVILVAGEEIK